MTEYMKNMWLEKISNVVSKSIEYSLHAGGSGRTSIYLAKDVYDALYRNLISIYSIHYSEETHILYIYLW